jgi:hypothetical protein
MSHKSAIYGGLRDEEKRNVKNRHPDSRKEMSYGRWTSPETRHGGWR